MNFNEKLITVYLKETNREMRARHKLNADLGIKGRFNEQKSAPKYSYTAVKGGIIK